jgi:BA14K-like protein
MSKLGILGATALSLSLAVATPALAQIGRGGGMHVGGGGGGMHVGGGGGMGGFRGAQASIGAGRVGAVSGGSFAGRGAQFSQGGAGFRGDHGRRFGRGVGFAAGLAAGSALGYGYYGSYYDPYYADGGYSYGDDYAYDGYYNGGYYDGGYSAYPDDVASSAPDPAYCAQRYRSYDPATGTYLGYDGLRHPCG